MINNVSLTGRLTSAPELQQTNSGDSVLTATIAVDRNFRNKNGEREADFIRFTAWKKTAEIIAQYCGKGSLVGIEGRIQTRNYENQQGQRVYITEVFVNNVSLLSSRSENNAQLAQDKTPSNLLGDNRQTSSDIDDIDLPF